MDTVRLFLYSKNFRRSKKKSNSKLKNCETISTPEEIDKSNSLNNLSIDIEDNQSSSSDKLSRENVKTFFSTHPSSTSIVSNSPVGHCELETCSGNSTLLSPKSTTEFLIAPSVSHLVSNARSFTNISSVKRHRSLILNNNYKRKQRRRSSAPGRNFSARSPILLSSIRRTQSARYPNRIRKHQIESKSKAEKLERNRIQVNK